MAGTLLVECGLVSSSQLAEALEHQRTHGGALDEVVSKLFGLPLGELRAAMESDASGIDVGAILYATNIIDEETLAEARQRSATTGQPVGPVLVEMGAVTRLELASALADQWSDSPAMILPAPNTKDKGKEDSSAEVDELKFAMRQLEASMRAARVTDGSEASLAELATREAELAARLEAVEAALSQPVEVDPAFLAEFQATVRRTHEIEAALAGLAPAEALAVFAGAAEEVRGLQGALSELGSRVEQGLTADALEPVIAQIADLAARVEGLANGEPAPTLEEVAAIRALAEEVAARPLADPSSVETLAARIEGLATALPELDVRDELGGLRGQLEELAARPVVDEGLTARVDELAAQVVTLSERPTGDSALGDRVEELARSVDALSVLAEASSGAEGLQEALTGLAARIEETATGNAGTAEAIAELRSQLEAHASRLDESAVGTNSLAEAIGEVRVQVEAQAAHLADSSTEASGTGDAITELRTRLDGLALEVAESRGGIDGASATLADLVHRLAELEGRPVGDPELGGRVVALEERVDGLSVDALGPAAAAAVADVTARLDALAETKAEEAERIEALRARIEEVRAETVSATEAAAIDPELQSTIDETRAAVGELAARLEAAVSADDLEQLRASLPEPGLDQVTAQRLTSLEESVIAIGVAAGDPSAIDEISARLDQVSGAAEEKVSAVLARLDELEATAGSSEAAGAELGGLREEISALGESIESVRETLAGEIERLASTWAKERAALEDRVETLADSAVGAASGDGAASPDAPAAPELKKLQREMERLQDRVIEQERSLVEHFARREKALSDKVTGGSDASKRLAELTQLVEEQRARIDRLSSGGGAAGGGGGGASGDELATLKESLFLKLEKLASSIDWRFQRLEGGAGGGPAAAAARGDLHSKVDELTRVVEQLAAGTTVELPTFEEPAPGTVYLALVPTSTGHQLVEMNGTIPDVDDVIASPTRKGELKVVAVGSSPLPGDERACIFVEPVDAGAKPKARAKA
ncbi:MAG: hypothetical protein U0R50_13720 [Gaiellales bacterium]